MFGHEQQTEPQKQSVKLWEIIFGRPAQSESSNPASYVVDAVQKAEDHSIARVSEILGCTEKEARAMLVAHGWSVHSTIAAATKCMPFSSLSIVFSCLLMSKRD